MDTDAFLKNLEDIVEEHGVCVQYVGSNGESPAFGYTVGLSLADHPEFLIEGLPLELTHALLNDMGFSVLRSGMRFGPGDVVDHLIGSFPIALVAIDEPERYLLSSFEIRDRLRPEESGHSLSAVQIVMPDSEGRFPWIPGGSDQSSLLGQFRPSESRLVLPPAEERRAQGW